MTDDSQRSASDDLHAGCLVVHSDISEDKSAAGELE